METLDGEQTLARTIWGENRGGGVPGMQSVCNTILNRVAAKSWYGDNVIDVCLKHNADGVYQFTCWSPKDPNYKKLIDLGLDGRGFESALFIARTGLMGRLLDLTGGATHYHARSILPYWAKGLKPCAEVAGHLFYRDA